MMVGSICPSCGEGHLNRRRSTGFLASGFLACNTCGKLVIPPKGRQVEEPLESAVTTAAIEEAIAAEEEEVLEDGFTPPDYIEALVGWRAWSIGLATGTPWLHSVTYHDTPWPMREVMKATCPRNSGARGVGLHQGVPGNDCSCGLYSAKTREHLQSMNYHAYAGDAFVAMGEVYLWGSVIEGTQGWRAECGYPKVLYVPYEGWGLATRLRESYGVPVRLENTLRRKRKEDDLST